ncbi:MAG: HD domain-containing protein [Chloroflexi bacterium]|nr:HD domain-containing protein [Chloroflexota bacterium]
MAADLGRRCEQMGVRLDRALVESAALLHDVDKILSPADRPAGSHGDSGARWLSDRGFRALAAPVRGHPVTRMRDGAWFDAWIVSASLEAKIVAYADKRSGQRLISLEQRFDGWRKRHPEYAASLDEAWPRARRLEDDVCQVAGVRPAEIRRVRWVRRELARIAAR